MISHESRKLLFASIPVFHKIYLSPFKFYPVTNELKFASRRRLWFWYSVTFLNVFVHHPWSFYGLLDSFFTNEWSYLEDFILVFTGTLAILGFTTMAACIYYQSDYLNLHKRSVELNGEMAKLCNINLKTRDKLYTPLKNLGLFIGMNIAGLLPAMILTLHLPGAENFTRSLYVGWPNFFGKLLFAILQTFIFYIEISHILAITSPALYYLFVVSDSCAILCSDDGTISEKQKRRIHRKMELLQKHFVYIGEYSLAFIISVVFAMGIVIAYLGIKHYSDFPFVLWLILVIIGGFCFAWGRVCQRDLTKITESSEEFLTGMLQNERDIECQSFWKSCRTLEFRYGMFTITKESFNTLFFGVVVDQTINLLVSY